MFLLSAMVVCNVTDLLPGYVTGRQYDASEFLLHILNGVGTSVRYSMSILCELYC